MWFELQSKAVSGFVFSQGSGGEEQAKFAGLENKSCEALKAASGKWKGFDLT